MATRWMNGGWVFGMAPTEPSGSQMNQVNSRLGNAPSPLAKPTDNNLTRAFRDPLKRNMVRAEHGTTFYFFLSLSFDFLFSSP